jgi:hypothetical protein
MNTIPVFLVKINENLLTENRIGKCIEIAKWFRITLSGN